MSSTKKSGKSALKFSLDDIDCMVSSPAVKKETLKATTSSEPKTATTRAKSAASKRKKTSESETHHDIVCSAVGDMKDYYEKTIMQMSEKMAGLGSAAVAKDKAMSQLVSEKKWLEDQLSLAKAQILEEVEQATEKAKICAARSVFEARIKMAKEAGDPVFDKSSWDVEKWKAALADLGGEEDDEEMVETADVGTSGAKDACEVSKEKDEAAVEDAA